MKSRSREAFSGFYSGKAVVTEMATRLLLVTYNLWTRFVGVVKEQGGHTEAVTSRDERWLVPANLVESGRQKPRKLAVSENLGWHNPLNPPKWLADPSP